MSLSSLITEISESLEQETAPVAKVKDAYDNLPESIKAVHSRKEWLWMTDRQKADLVRNECEPEVFDD